MLTPELSVITDRLTLAINDALNQSSAALLHRLNDGFGRLEKLIAEART
jgi:hypothetical protein